jgi:hypothetical protein
MKVYIDENIAPQIAPGLHELQKPLNCKENCDWEIISINDRFGSGSKDEEWIPVAGKEGAIVITQDLRINSNSQQRALYMESGLGIFFFKPPSKVGYLYWDLVKQVINKWEEIKKLERKTKRPFDYRCTAHKSFEKINND